MLNNPEKKHDYDDYKDLNVVFVWTLKFWTFKTKVKPWSWCESRPFHPCMKHVVKEMFWLKIVMYLLAKNIYIKGF